MNSVPKIAIVIPMLNEAETLLSLLSGIAGQSLMPNEVIVIDSGSVDRSVSIVENWAKDDFVSKIQVRVITNLGGMPGANRNLGVGAANSDWIAFIDAGIVPSPNWLECLWSCATHTKAKAIFGLCFFEAIAPFEMAVCALSYGCTARHPVLPASLFHSSVFIEIGLFEGALRAAEDVLWMRKVERQYGPKVVCNDALVYYRHFPSNLTKVIRKWWMYQCHIMRIENSSGKRLMLPLFFSLLAVIFFVVPILGFVVLIVYILLRGVFDPIRRSHSFFWWAKDPYSALIALWLGVVIDITKSLSTMYVLMRRLARIDGDR
jgi:glycosyltransferase involved in cell wall biosynthesis